MTQEMKKNFEEELTRLVRQYQKHTDNNEDPVASAYWHSMNGMVKALEMMGYGATFNPIDNAWTVAELG